MKRRGALVVGLTGCLGAGKTNFVQGTAEFLGITRNITSPTFVLMKRYRLEGNPATLMEGTKPLRYFESLYHIDCYRIQSSAELLDLGWEELINDKRNIIFVEWAEKIKDIMPDNSIFITIENTDNPSERKITVDPHTPKQ